MQGCSILDDLPYHLILEDGLESRLRPVDVVVPLLGYLRLIPVEGDGGAFVSEDLPLPVGEAALARQVRLVAGIRVGLPKHPGLPVLPTLPPLKDAATSLQRDGPSRPS